LSTVIQNGYMMDKKFLNMGYLKEFMKEMQQEIQDKQVEIETEQQAFLAKNILIAYHLKNAEEFDSYLKTEFGIENKGYDIERLSEKAMKEKGDRIKKEHFLAEREYDLSCEIIFIPTKTKMLALLYTQHREIRDIWESSEKVHEYGYWNNTDKPKELTKREWNTRRNDWNKALPGLGVPREEGFIFTIDKPFHFMTKERLFLEMRELDSSIRLFVEEELEKEYYEKNPLKEGFSTVEFSRSYYSFRKWMESEEGEKRREEVTKNIRKKLPCEINEKVLELKKGA